MFIRCFFVLAVFFFISILNAAIAPLSQVDLERQSVYIVSGIVLSVSSSIRKSKAERSFGINRDRVYKFIFKIKQISKGQELKEGDEIMESFLAKTYKLGSGVNVNALNQIDWSSTMSFSRQNLNGVGFERPLSVSFLSKVNDGVFF
tara:strand:- start:126 stop:566 length:441 start_codon:yes stop_codon:yes gene_type:complete